MQSKDVLNLISIGNTSQELAILGRFGVKTKDNMKLSEVAELAK